MNDTLPNTQGDDDIRVQPALPCLLCGADGTLLHSNLRDRIFNVPGTWTLRFCRSCGLAWLDPRPLPGEVGKLYREYVTHTVLEPPAKPWTSFAEGFRDGILTRAFAYPPTPASRSAQFFGRASAWLGVLRDRAGATVMWLNARRGRLLDVGCGNGEFLARMRSLGWEVQGVEPDPAAARIAAEKFKLNVAVGPLAEADLPPASFDAVATNHVFEHVLDPVGFLRHCRTLLKKDGLLALTTPNLESLGHRWTGPSWVGLDPPRHLFLFTRPALETCARRAGLRIVDLRSVARVASWMWVGSRQIQRSGRFSLADLDNRGIRLWVEGLSFLAFECALVPFRPVGEELLLVAAPE